MSGMIITVLHCSERKKRGSKGETGREEREETGAWDRGKGGESATETRGQIKQARGMGGTEGQKREDVV